MADIPVQRFPDFAPESDFGQIFLVGYKDTDKKERRFNFNDLLTFLGYSDYSNAQIQTWLDAGFTWVEIGVLLLQRQNLKRDIAEPFTLPRIPTNQVDALIAYIKTPQGFAKTGIALCDGTAFVDNSGTSWNIKNRNIKGYSPGISVDGAPVVAYQTQEDAMQAFSYQEANEINQPINLDKTIGGNLYDVTAGSSAGGDGGFTVTNRTTNRGVLEGGSSKFVNISFSARIQQSWTIFKQWTNTITNQKSGIRTSSETRSKGIFFPYFQVVYKLDWTTIDYKQPTSLTP